MKSFLKKELEDAGFIVKEIYPEILMINNFISNEEINEILQIINLSKEEDWLIEYRKNLKNFCIENFGTDDVDFLVAKGKFEITKQWDDKNLSIRKKQIYKKIFNKIAPLINKANKDYVFSGLDTLQRMQEGTKLTAHYDQHTDSLIQYATILYVNDNYSGGELFFDNIDLKIKPKAGSLLVFPGTEKYRHGVEVVGAGPTRYVIVGFIKKSKFLLKINKK